MAQHLKLITEVTNDVKTLVEAKENGPSTYYVEGVFMQGNLKNQNGRIYPTELLGREVERYSQAFINENRAFGELGHPAGPTVNLDRVSHMIKVLERDGDCWHGRAKVTTHTPMGAIVKALIDEEAKLGVSSRGLGSVRETSTGMLVQNDFYFSTVDIVAEPSAPDAFVRGIMENKEWVWDNGLLRESEVATLQREVANAHAPGVTGEDRSQRLQESYKRFFRGLRTGMTVKVSRY